MIQLIKLEFMKWKLSGFLRSLFITTLILIGMIIPPLFFDNTDSFKEVSELFRLIDTIARLTYIIFSGVLLARIVMDEYQTNTMQLMFTYPIPRKKILIAKLLLVIGITFVCLLLSRLLLWLLISLINSVSPFLPYQLWSGISTHYLITTCAFDLTASTLCMISFFFGMLRKSSRTATVTSIIISTMINGNFGDVSLGASLLIPTIISSIGISFVYFTIRNIEVRDFV